MQRFDEVELQAVSLEPLEIEPARSLPRAPRLKQLLALLTDLSLFAALSLALSTLLPQPHGWRELTALAGFVLMVSFYYFAGAWTLWGKTIGGAIFDARVEKRTLRDASLRWAGLVAAVGTMSALVYVAVL